MSETVHGEAFDGGGVRLEGDGDGEWIEADYREGWVGRKLMNARNPDAYAEMVEPYFFKCTWCREYQSTMRWGAGSNLCPRCEQKRLYTVGEWFKATEDGQLPMPTDDCPECGSENIEIGVIADFDSVCHDCEHAWSNRAVPKEDCAE